MFNLVVLLLKCLSVCYQCCQLMLLVQRGLIWSYLTFSKTSILVYLFKLDACEFFLALPRLGKLQSLIEQPALDSCGAVPFDLLFYTQ